MKTTAACLIFLVSLAYSEIKGQEKVYFRLEKDKYSKSVLIRPVAWRMVTSYSFTLPCQCPPYESLGFLGHNNPINRSMTEPIRTISNRDLKKIKFISFSDLIKISTKHGYFFDNKYTLYLVEPGKVNYIYHVLNSTSWI